MKVDLAKHFRSGRIDFLRLTVIFQMENWAAIGAKGHGFSENGGLSFRVIYLFEKKP